MVLDDVFQEGRRIGSTMRRELVASARASARPREWIEPGLQLTMRACPLATSFIDGCARGAGLSFVDVFATWYEEIPDGRFYDLDRGCTDVVVVRPDEVVVAHTNDTDPGAVVHVDRIQVRGKPCVTMIFSDGGPSAAANDAGVVFSGNQLDARDTRPGIPRQALYFEACFSRDIETAARVLLHPSRASSFNNVLADDLNRVLCLEASATHAVSLQPVDGVLVHTNHYLVLPGVEARTGRKLANSRNRFARAVRSVDEHSTDEDLLKLMTTHGRGGLCRHGETQTRFSVLFRPASLDMLLGVGNPCQTSYCRLSLKGTL